MSATPAQRLPAAGPPTTCDEWAEVVRLCRSVLYAWLRRQGVQHADAEDLLGEALATVARELPASAHASPVRLCRTS
jgi:hypothetical protein